MAALIQHEYDHLDGILYPMQMKDFSYFGYNDYQEILHGTLLK